MDIVPLMDPSLVSELADSKFQQSIHGAGVRRLIKKQVIAFDKNDCVVWCDHTGGAARYFKCAVKERNANILMRGVAQRIQSPFEAADIECLWCTLSRQKATFFKNAIIKVKPVHRHHSSPGFITPQMVIKPGMFWFSLPRP